MKILSLIREILPHAAAINRLNVACGHSSARAGHSLLKDEHFSVESSSGTGSASGHCHYAIVESDHPYKPASVSNYKVGD